MASREKHSMRSKYSSKSSKAGMNAMDENGKLKTMRHKKLKEAKNAGVG